MLHAAPRRIVRTMHATERDQSPSTSNVVGGDTEEGPALRDAALAAARADDDEREALIVRERLREGPMPALEPDPGVAEHLRPGELVHGLRRSAILRAPGEDRALGYGGTLYLTSHRLIHVGQVTMNVQLRDILETSLSAERLLITLRDGEGIAVDVDRPRTFRTEIAAALRGARA
jgi:hypothetical protein